MANKTVKMVIQLRRDSSANWELHKDIVPAIGEPCFVTDKNILKIGDGVKTFEQLDPINGVKVDADGKSLVFEDGVLKLAGFDAAEVGAQPRKNAEGNIEWVVPSTETVDGLKATVAGLQSDVKTIQEIVTPSGDGEQPLLTRVETLEEQMNGTGEGSVDKKIDAKINEFATNISDDGIVNSYKELIDYVANHGSEAATLAADITLLQSLVDSKVDKVDGMGLSSNDFKDSLLNKLEAIEENAQANVIEKISVGGSILDVLDKAVNIPVASLDNAGVVKSATGANKVNISNSGEMSVNKVSINSIFIPIGDELILDGGSAYKETPVYPTRVGNIGYDSIADAVNYADNGDIITLQEDINMGAGDNDNLIINAENITIDLAGKTLTANGSNGAIKVEGGVTTLDGTGTVSSTLGSDNYSMAVWCVGENVKVVINDGIYKNATDGSDRGTDLIYASSGGNIEINGGTFIAAKPEWTLNVKDSDYKSGISNIVVRGGKFYKFNPADCSCEGAHTNFVADGYKSVQDGDYYIVVPIE